MAEKEFNFIKKQKIAINQEMINKNNNRIKTSNNFLFKYFFNISFIKYINFIFLLFIPILRVYKINLYKFNFVSNSEYIILKINKGGYQNILGADNYITCPDAIYLNDGETNIKNSGNCRIININSNQIMINTIKLVWNSKLSYIQGLFENLNNIIEIDISNFDSSLAKYMNMMFYGCSSLTSINFGNFITSSMVDMRGMFYMCTSLQNLDLSSFDTSKVTNMTYLFYNCEKIVSLKLGNFDTSNVLDMKFMYYGCENLIFLNLSMMNTSLVSDISYMFAYCYKLQYLDLSNFETPKLKDMYSTFLECESLTSLDISKFNTSLINDMDGLFYKCIKLQSLNLSSFDTSNVVKMNYMFTQCFSLTSLNLSNFNTEKVLTMEAMFANCRKMEFLDVSSFNTNLVSNMEYMFFDCSSLTFINISNFNTPSLNSFIHMFDNCVSLISLDISNLNTQIINNMGYLFRNCQKLKYLNISNFVTSNVKYMNNLFENCYSLESLDISNFDTSSVINMYSMFNSCTSLISLNLSKFLFNSVFNMSNMFYNCELLEYINIHLYNESPQQTKSIKNILDYIPENIVICINENNNKNNLLLEINKKICPVIFCGNDWKTHQKIIKNNKCEVNYLTTTENVILISKEKTNNFSEELNVTGETIKIKESHEETSFTVYTTNFISGINFITTDLSKIDVNNTYPSYYNINFSIDETKQVSNTILNNNKEETTDKSEEEKFNLTINSSIKIDEINNLDLAISSFNEIESEIIFNTIKNSNSEIIEMTSEFIESKNYTSEEINQKLYEHIIGNMLQILEGKNGEEIIFEGKDNFFYQLTNLENELNNLDKKNNNSNRFSKIDLGDCENVLRDEYNLGDNVSLLILKYEKISNISSERYLQYEVYESLNKKRLNLSLCKDIPIDVYIPVMLSDKIQNLYNELKDLGYDLFDINSKFYQDICTPYNSANGTDVLLSDRINYYFNNEETQCQPNCQFSDYSFETQDLKCECDIISSEINVEKKQEIGSKSIYKSFYDVLKFSNYKVLKCYKLAFSLNIFPNNKGNILVIIFFGIYLIFLTLYLIKGTEELKIDFLKFIINEGPKRINFPINSINHIPIIFHSNLEKNKIKIINNLSNEKEKIQNKNNSSNNNKRLILRKHLTKKTSTKNFPPKKNLYENDKFNINRINGDKNFFKENDYNNSLNSNNIMRESSGVVMETKNFNKVSKDDNKENLDNFELNNLDYNKALKFDKRNFFKIYWSLLRREHLIIFTFLIRNDHNIKYIKYCKFIINICSDMAMNVFFFSDESMHKMYLDYGKYNFVQQIPQIIYSTIISQLIEVFLCYLSLIDKHYYQTKSLNIRTKQKLLRIVKFIQIKLTIFLIFTGIILLFYWYIITCFCAVYINTQIAFIKDSLSSFGFGLLYPFILYLFPSTLRIISLKLAKGKLSFIYKLSDIIPFF